MLFVKLYGKMANDNINKIYFQNIYLQINEKGAGGTMRGASHATLQARMEEVGS